MGEFRGCKCEKVNCLTLHLITLSLQRQTASAHLQGSAWHRAPLRAAPGPLPEGWPGSDPPPAPSPGLGAACCQGMPLKDASLCLALLTGARASRAAQSHPSQLSAPDTAAWRVLCSCGFARTGVWQGEKKLGGLLSTPLDISKAIRECCLPGTRAPSVVLAVVMDGAHP